MVRRRLDRALYPSRGRICRTNAQPPRLVTAISSLISLTSLRLSPCGGPIVVNQFTSKDYGDSRLNITSIFSAIRSLAHLTSLDLDGGIPLDLPPAGYSALRSLRVFKIAHILAEQQQQIAQVIDACIPKQQLATLQFSGRIDGSTCADAILAHSHTLEHLLVES